MAWFLLPHLTSYLLPKGIEIKIIYYFINSIQKMAFNIQRNYRNVDRNLSHFGLIKIMVEEELQLRGDNWEDFLLRNHFKEAPKEMINQVSK